MVKTFDELTCYKIFASTESENFVLPAINDGLLQQTTETQPTVVSIKGSLLLLSLYLVMKYTCRDIFSSKMVFFFSIHRFQKKTGSCMQARLNSLRGKFETTWGAGKTGKSKLSSLLRKFLRQC